MDRVASGQGETYPASLSPAVSMPANSVAGVAAARPGVFNGFLLSYVLTVASLATAVFLWGKRGSDLVVVAMGWPHVFFGLLFNLRRLSAAEIRDKLFFAMLLLVTLSISVVHSLIPITTLIYLYFVFHAFRDEIFIYRQRITGQHFRGRVFDGAGRALLIAAAALALLAQFVPHSPQRQLQYFSAECGLAFVLSALALLGRPRRWFESSPGLRYAFPAALLVFLAMTAMKLLRAHGMNAPLFFSFLVVFHYFSWYVFSFEKIRARSPLPVAQVPSNLSFFDWISSGRGFAIAMVALNVASFAAAYSYQVLHVSATLAYGFDLKYFLYPLVFHVTTSFSPKPRTRIPVARTLRAGAGA